MAFNLYDYPFINLNTFSLMSIDFESVSNIHTPTLISDSQKSSSSEDSADMGVCKLCGRKLKDKHSCILGMGPICFRKYKDRLNSSKSLF